jgi:hypothetical protein
VVFVLPLDFSLPIELGEEDFLDDDEGIVKVHEEISFDIENVVVFFQPNWEMKSHLNKLFIKAQVEGKVIRRVLVDGRAVINLIPEHMVRKLNKSFSVFLPHSMVITN